MKLREVYEPLLIICLLNIGQQFSGLNVMRVYIVKIFNTVFSTTGPGGKSLSYANCLQAIRILDAICSSAIKQNHFLC